MNKKVLIGGASAVGKSYITQKLTEESSLPWVSTDGIREAMRKGTAIMPKLVSNLNSKQFNILPIFLIDENRDRVREVNYTRGFWVDASTYSDKVKDLEVEWAIFFDQYIDRESKTYGHKVCQIGKRETLIDYLTQDVR